MRALMIAAALLASAPGAASAQTADQTAGPAAEPAPVGQTSYCILIRQQIALEFFDLELRVLLLQPQIVKAQLLLRLHTALHFLRKHADVAL